MLNLIIQLHKWHRLTKVEITKNKTERKILYGNIYYKYGGLSINFLNTQKTSHKLLKLH